MPTTKIMVIRHAEKPNGDGGVMPDGTPNPEALTVAGWQRAGALVGLFAPPGGRFADPHLATPQAIYASGMRITAPACDRNRPSPRLPRGSLCCSTRTILKATKQGWCGRRRRSGVLS